MGQIVPKEIAHLSATQMESFRLQSNGFRLGEKTMEELNATARKAKKKSRDKAKDRSRDKRKKSEKKRSDKSKKTRKKRNGIKFHSKSTLLSLSPALSFFCFVKKKNVFLKKKKKKKKKKK